MSTEQEVFDAQILRENLFTGDLLQLPRPEEGMAGFLPEWFDGSLPALIFPPIDARSLPGSGQVDLQITPYHLFYGALRELAETADSDRSAVLRRLVLEWHPQAALEVCELARLHVEQDVETALLHYELALELDETLYEAVQDAGMCEFARSSQDEDEQDERLEAAEDLFRRALELNPQAGLSAWSLARSLNEQGRGAEAQLCLRRFLEEQPAGEQRELVEAALLHGFEAAEADEADDDHQELFVRAQALAFGDAPAEAVSLLQPLADAYPESGELWFVLGAAHRRSGNTDEAERCLRRAARLAPGEPFVWWELSRACMDAAQWPAAEDAIRKSLEMDPENAIYFADLARIRLARGDRSGAEESIAAAQNLAPDDPSVQEAAAALGR